jgi:putative ABC transport system substrate-binding protein
MLLIFSGRESLSMKRREFITFAGCFLVSPITAAAQEARIRRIGFLRVGPPPPAFIKGFRQGLRELGMLEGQHFVIEYGLAQSAAQVPKAAADLVAHRIDILVASGTPSVLPARDAARQTPVVFVATVDPVRAGLVASLARPGGNLTGTTSISGNLAAKRLELVRELLPGLTKIAILVRESSPTAPQYLEESRIAARKLGFELHALMERNPEDLDRLFTAARESRAALVLGDDAEFTALRVQIAEMGIKNKLPTVSGFREMVEAGGLMAYGANFGDLYRRAAAQVHKIILQGVSPGEIPVELPTKFELVLNMRTAKALGLSFPPSLLARADEVIE